MKKKFLLPIMSMLSLVVFAAPDPANIFQIKPWHHVEVEGSSVYANSHALTNGYNYTESYASGKGTVSDPITGGRFYFLIRLLNSGWNNGENIPWDFPTYKDISGVLDPSSPQDIFRLAAKFATNPPKIGLVVGGRTVYATICDIFPDSLVNSDSTSSAFFTDIVCYYDVKPGDLAMPVRLAAGGDGKDGVPVSSGANAYCFLNSDNWIFYNTNKTAEVAFKFIELNTDGLPKSPDKSQYADSTERNGRKNFDLSLSGINIQTVHIENDSYDVPLDPLGESPVEVKVLVSAQPEVGESKSMGKYYFWTYDPNDPDGGTPAVEIVGYNVYTQDLSGATEYTINVKGMNQGKSAILRMSQYPKDVAMYNPTLENYVEATLNCTEPKAKILSVTPKDTSVVANNGNDYLKPVTELDLSLLGGCTNTAGLVVKVKPTLEGSHDSDDWRDYVRLSYDSRLTSLPEPPASASDSAIDATFAYQAAKPNRTPIYVYALRSDRNNTKVRFNIEGYTPVDATSVLISAKPEISSLQLYPVGSSFTKGGEVEIGVSVEDTYADTLKGGYSMSVTFYGDNGAETAPLSYDDLILTNGMLHVRAVAGGTPTLPKAAMPLSGGVYAKVTITSPLSKAQSGATSEAVSVSDLDVKANIISGSVSELGECAEGEPIEFNVTIPSAKSFDLYAFLVCTNQDSLISAKVDTNSAFVVCKDTDLSKTAGLKITGGKNVVTSQKGVLTLLDNTPSDDPVWYFDVVLATQSVYSADAVYSGFTSTVLALAPTNMPAKVASVTAEDPDNTGNRITVGAGESLGTVPARKSRTFTVDVDDTTYDCATDMTVKWSIFRSSLSGNAVTNMTFKGDVSSAASRLTYKFPGANDSDASKNIFYVKVEVCDKDSNTFFSSVNRIEVRPTYAVTVSASSTTISEGSETSYISVGLDGWDDYVDEDLTVQLDLVPRTITSDPGKQQQGTLKLDYNSAIIGQETLGPTNRYYLRFGSATKHTLYLDTTTLDGTKLSGDNNKGGYYAYASVTNTVNLPSIGSPANEYYAGAASLIVRKLENAAPRFVDKGTTEANSDTNAWVVAGGSARAIRYEVTDCDADALGIDTFNGLKVVFDGDLANPTNFYLCSTNDAGLKGSFIPDFGTAVGDDLLVNMTVIDKDGGESDPITYHYKVKQAKFLTTIASGPSTGDTLSNLSSLYQSASGIGKGRTYVTGSGINFSSAESFRIIWNCGTASAATLWAYGYKHGKGDKDSTPESAGYIELDAYGNRAAGAGDPAKPYVYRDGEECDSFFYGWIQPDEIGGKEYSITVSPGGDRGEIILPTDLTGDETGYLPTSVEAIFSRERYRCDNMGDIDQDGIPDIFALKKYASGGALATDDHKGGELGAVNNYNDDGDYIPGGSLSGSNLIPGTPNTFRAGTPFNAETEIRGMHRGLNYGMFKFVTAEREDDPDYKEGSLAPRYKWTSDLELSDAEKRSLLNHAIARRDAILNNYKNNRVGLYDANDWRFVTNLLATAIRADSSVFSSDGIAAAAGIPAYIVDYANPPSGSVTIDYDVEEFVSNKVFGVEVYARTTTNDYSIYTYESSAGKTITVTNLINVAGVTNEQILAHYYKPNPYDAITVDNINISEFLQRNLGGTYERQALAAKAYIDNSWRHYPLVSQDWGWTCENRTNPMIDDTDGDGMPDGYEYFMWYGAVVGNNGTTRLSGYRFNASDLESRGTPITSDEIVQLYNPNVKGVSKGTDTDRDGLSDYEEFLLGTNPLDWDTDGDGLADFYETSYNMSPLSAAADDGAQMNVDGDFMALATSTNSLSSSGFGDYKYVVTDTNGVVWAMDRFPSVDVITNSMDFISSNNCILVTANVFRVKYYRTYYIPTTEEVYPDFLETTPDSADESDDFFSRPHATNTTIAVKVTAEMPKGDAVIALYHHQVENFFGFDPRTGWYASDIGLSTTARWRNTVPETVPGGAPQNTVPFTAIDEFTLHKYLNIVGDGALSSSAKSLLNRMTNPNKAFTKSNWSVIVAATSTETETDESEAESSETSGEEGEEEEEDNNTYHGADTDGDGVPDGWELYIGVNPCKRFGIDEDRYGPIEKLDNGDALNFVAEYAGTDSCGVYKDCPTIFANHPSSDTSPIKGWFNKFFPTDPRVSDTDGDGISDGGEGSSWKGYFTCNRFGDEQVRYKGANFYSIYGDPVDNGTVCIRGGGYNPCTIDTDCDGLPDGWERQYSGILFNGTKVADNSDENTARYNVFESLDINTNIYKDVAAALAAYRITERTNPVGTYQILMGMDGTVADASTSTSLGAPSCDWDGDGLENWQEYMVQAMRHFRYDDDKTPLLGRDCPVVETGEHKADAPGGWYGDKGFLKVSYTKPFTKGQLEYIRDEFGYDNFVDWALAKIEEGEDYLAELGYFTDPPMEWDYARNTLKQKYMLARSTPKSYRGSTYYKVAEDEYGNPIWLYKDANGVTQEYIGETKVNNAGTRTAKVYIEGKGNISVEVTPKSVQDVGAGYRIYDYNIVTASSYISSDPRLWDTDCDGMDDYYELFHGLNPILGNISQNDGYSSRYDIIANAFLGAVTPWKNAWIGWTNREAPVYDPIRYPWLMGTAMCDADGDGIRNSEEMILANITSPNARHTDPTPLWMTDASVTTREIEDLVVTTTVVELDEDGDPIWVWDSSKNDYVQKVEISATEYDGDPIEFVDTPSYTALFYGNELRSVGVNDSSLMHTLKLDGDKWRCTGLHYIASFEQNEGYDTDNDWRSDSAELKYAAEPTSDPQNFNDPQRRQSIWFGGEENKGMALTYSPSTRNYGASDLFKQFTVEAWIRPEEPVTDADQYAVARAAHYDSASLVNSNKMVRLDFALGVDKEGNPFAEIQNSVDVTYRLARVGAPLDPNKWVHLAGSFDGSSFVLYVNGEPVADVTTTIIPANGTISIVQDPHYSRMGSGFYRQANSIVAVGARPIGADAFGITSVTPDTDWSDVADCFFKGSVDEVRCWDGARTATAIKGDYLTRYTTAAVKAQRDEVHAAYITGLRRNDTKGSATLPPELIHHYNFATLASAAAEENVQRVPSGFEANVLACVRNPDNSDSIGDLVKIGWWNKLGRNVQIGSKVYTSPHVVPWIEDTVAHLPDLCGRVADSVFWSENFAGWVPANDNGLSKYSFPNTMNPYGVVNYMLELDYMRTKFASINNSTNETANADPESSLMNSDDLYALFLYDTRRGFSGNSDMIPLGSAYAKRLTEYWDGTGPEDAWAITTTAGVDDGDPSDNGIPDWATNVCSSVEEYRAAISDGLLPSDADFHEEYSIYGDNVDTNGNSIPDWWERYFNLVGCDANADPDNDGLSNFQEYLISFGDWSVAEKQSVVLSKGICRNKGMRLLDPTNAHSPDTNGTVNAVVDYFLKPDGIDDARVTTNSYYGEMVGDHDFMETWWESMYGVDIANPTVYDAHLDKDGNGWDNWSEARARYNENTWVVTGEATNIVEYTFSSFSDTDLAKWSMWYYDALSSSTTIVAAKYYNENGEFLYNGNWGTPVLGTRVVITAYEKTPVKSYGGQPLPNIRVKIYGADQMGTNGVRLAAYTGSTLDRPDASFYLADTPVNGLIEATVPGAGVKQGLNTFIATTSDGKIAVARNVQVGFDSAKVEMTLANSDLYFTYSLLSAATNVTSSGKVEIERVAVNGETLEVPRRVYTKIVDLSGGVTFTPAEIIGSTAPDFDWRRFAADMVELGDVNATTVDYVVNVNGETVATFTRKFNSTRTPPVSVSPVDDAPVYSCQPTFQFASSDDTMTAYRMQVCKADGTLVWDSGAKELPAATPYSLEYANVWAVTPELYVDNCASTNGSPMFADGSNYVWRVALLNAKYPTVAQESDWSAWATFQMDVGNNNRNPDTQTGYGNAAAVVRYYGAGDVTDISGSTNIVVEAYSTPDFTGSPVARKILADISDLSSADDIKTANVTLNGIAPGNTYLLAYIDTNNNGRRDKWESWGYANGVDSGTMNLYTPKAVKVTDEKNVYPQAAIYIEDCDRNQNEIPDLFESIEVSSSIGDSDGDGLLDDEEGGYGSDPSLWDTDGDGMPDGWEIYAETDPLEADGEYAANGDVMAYAEVVRKVVSFTGDAKTYFVVDGDAEPRVGDVATDYGYFTTYAYGDKLGLGLAATAPDGARIAAVETKSVVLIHAQVYDKFGFDPNTANPTVSKDDRVRTKAFTALDKYLVVRYLAATGLTVVNEEVMNATRAWSSYTLKPGTIDSDADGIADGWELYVGASPWNFADRASDADSDDLSLVDEFNAGLEPFDPGNKYSVYDNFLAAGLLLPGTTQFSDGEARRFGVSEDDIDKDDDNDQLTNLQEIQAYYRDRTVLADIDTAKAWSDGETPDYFRAIGSTYLGLLFNGGEFIEPEWREALGIEAFVGVGTRDYNNSGWDAWSIVRNSDDSALDGVADTDLAFVLEYLDAVVPGECSAKTLPELRDFIHERWKGVTREARQGSANDDYNYSYEYDEETGSYSYHRDSGDEDATITWLTLRGEQLVTLDEIILFFGGREAMMKTIAANEEVVEVEDILMPEPKVDLVLKYAGDTKAVVLVEAWQVNPSYPEYGEQRTAFWNIAGAFSAGIAKFQLATANSGSLVQGPARFVAYIDVDGDGKLSPGDTYGSAKCEIGYMGCSLAIALGEANPALPVISLSDGTNSVSTLALVRSEINGKPLYNSAKGVFIVKFPNNAARESLYPGEYDTGSYIGIDSTLSTLDNVDEVESVTYEVLRLRADEVAGLSVSNLNNYVVVRSIETDGERSVVSNIVSQALNETVTFRYSLDRDVAGSIACSGSTADDLTLSFTVPTDTANTKFWLNVQADGAATATLLGGTKGFILNDVRDGVVVLDRYWFESNKVTIPTGLVRLGVILGNDKFGKPEEPASCAMAEVFINKGASYEGRIAVKVEHPTVALGAKLTVAAYEKADLANPVAVKSGCATGETVEIKGLRPDASYYVAAWYVKDADDGRGSKERRMPYDSWGYICNLTVTNANQVAKNMVFDPVAVFAAAAPVVTNMVWLQDTDWNDNGIVDREEDFRAINGVYQRSVDPVYGFEVAGVDETAIFSDAEEGDVFAYAEVPFYCVMAEIDGAQKWFAVTDLDAETLSDKVTPGIPVGASLKDIVSLKATYLYDYGKSGAKRLALGTNVVYSGEAKVVKVVEDKVLILAHGQVYDRFGFNQNTANGRVDKSSWVNTRAFTSVDKVFVTNYLANVLGYTDVCGYGLSIECPDADVVADGRGDGILDGWELYVKHNPWDYGDRTSDVDGDGLDLLHEYNGGIRPTDPWNGDTDGDGISDKASREFFFVKAPADTDGRTGYRGDYDNDQLSNFIEYLIQGLPDTFPNVSASKMSTFDGQLVPDYFLRHGSLYLGEMFTDHDMIEDWWEDEHEGYSRYSYDTVRDGDGDGWSDWAEARIEMAGVTNPPSASVALYYNGDGKLSKSQTVTVVAWREGSNYVGTPDAMWTFDVSGLDEGHAVAQLGEPDTGRLREGRHMFAAYAGSGDFEPGVPYGIATGVDVGYMSVEPFSIEMTDVDPSIVRIDLGKALASQYEACVVVTNKDAEWWQNVAINDPTARQEHNAILEPCYSAIAQGATDRGQTLVDYATLHMPEYFGTNVNFAVSNTVYVWFTQMLINGEKKDSYYKKALPSNAGPVRFYVNFENRSVLTEADMLAGLKTLDLGWDTLVSSYLDGGAGNRSDLTNAVFGIIFKVGPSAFEDENNLFAVEIENHYEWGKKQSPVSYMVVKNDHGRPIFAWMHKNDIGNNVAKAYPAFQLQVWKNDDSKTLVYDSGALRAPARDKNGVYRWTAPMCVGSMTAEGQVFEANTEYLWAVSMLDAKFTSALPLDTTVPGTTCGKFTMSDDSLLSDCGSIAVAVKYMGPASTVVAANGTDVSKLVRVEAYATPDFSGKPVAETFVRTKDTIADTNVIVMNARLTGLPKGKRYYVRAYIDTDGDCEHDAWESWGYGNYVGDDSRRDVYTPRAYGIAVDPNDEFTTPTAVVYIEDADTNDNKLPDAWEVEEYGVLGSTSVAAKDPFIVTIDTADTTPRATNIFYVVEKDIIDLPYYSALTEMQNGGRLSAASLALAMSGIDLAQLSVSPKVTILDFSPTAGLTIEIDAGTKLDGITLAATPVTVNVQLDVTVEYVTSLAADWTAIDGSPFSATIPLSAGKQILTPTDLPEMTSKIKSFAASNPAVFFRVRAVKAVHK